MIFAIITTAFVLFLLWSLFIEQDGELFGFAFLFGGFVYGVLIVGLMPWVFTSNYEASSVPIENSSIHSYEVDYSNKDIIVYTDPDGVEHAISEEYFTNHEEARVVEVCSDNIWWVSPWAWEDCRTEVFGNIN